MHIHLAFRFSKGRTEEMGTCQNPYCVYVYTHLVCTVYICVPRASLNGWSLFILTLFLGPAVTTITNALRQTAQGERSPRPT